ncbi:maleylpyruvate isomerase N-terminal domain-containing protein [Isoptericola variabilis]|uniref:Mycothiol-dependent maleylpyruvate isomerase metal-binding domain-containing protein n=1 Tax=Isoptericola variabilis (strain 225) TaxID=743718 RepID=F6FPJ5_ISOV2|nr:maleylpyruvate isomerase N-terminal domain-containing protein [Isoptericola variabilis]AEG44727.1 Conserved hypothetical protein CHP03083 [Isoptericola variabilis 225]TWH27142.1 MDMPI-like protein [Isoptericola variabilis J7]
MSAPGVDDLPLLGRLQAAFLDGTRTADLSARVPACGRWRTRNLVEHLARIHHWAAAQASRTRETPLGRGPFDLPELYERCARELLETLDAVGPDAESSTLVGRGPARFWRRRQVHETLVHLHDLRAAALGSAEAVAAEHPIDVGPEVWADTVDEVVTMFQPRQVRLGRTEPLARTVALTATDVGTSWVLGAHEDGRDASQAPAATVAAPARELALVLWRRLTPEQSRVVVDGDRSALDHALAARITP